MDDHWALSSSHVYLVLLASGAGKAHRRGCMLFSQFVHVWESQLLGEKDRRSREGTILKKKLEGRATV
jgi:hypothetical protein